MSYFSTKPFKSGHSTLSSAFVSGQLQCLGFQGFVLTMAASYAACCRVNSEHISQSRPDSGLVLSHVQCKSPYRHLRCSLLETGLRRAWIEGVQALARTTLLSPFKSVSRYRANMAHIRQSRPDSRLGSQLQVLQPLFWFLKKHQVRFAWVAGGAKFWHGLSAERPETSSRLLDKSSSEVCLG